MKIIAHKSISYEDALDAVICAENGLPPNREDLTVSFFLPQTIDKRKKRLTEMRGPLNQIARIKSLIACAYRSLQLQNSSVFD